MSNDISAALAVLRRGGLVAMPTETVYGLAADASNEAAVRRIFSAKGRPADHPLIVHIADVTAMDQWAAQVPHAAHVLTEACWPGPLTVLVPRAAHVLSVVTGGRDTVGLRVPAHPLALELLREFGGGLAAPSANRFGQVSPTSAQHVRDDLGADVDLVLDGGACPIGVESTIVDCTVDPPQVLRPGGIPTEHIAALLEAAGSPNGSALAAPAGPRRASGMLASHYAPRCRVLLADSPAEVTHLLEVARARGEHVDVIGDTSDVVAYAHHLFTWLRAADARGLDSVVALLPETAGLGHAIRDRLAKAAADAG